MYRLTDDVAKRRLHYPPPLMTTPHAVLLDLPPARRGPGLLLDRFYLVLAETDAEMEEFEHFLAEPRARPVRPSLLDERASAIRSDGLTVIRYAPPVAGWPWLSVCRWPDDLLTIIARDVAMARGCYSFEAFPDRAGLDDHSTSLLASLRERVAVSVQFVGADRVAAAGRT